MEQRGYPEVSSCILIEEASFAAEGTSRHSPTATSMFQRGEWVHAATTQRRKHSSACYRRTSTIGDPGPHATNSGSRLGIGSRRDITANDDRIS